MIIDTHCHVIATDTKKYPLKPLFGKQSDWSAEHPIDYPDMVAAGKAAGVDKSVLVQASSAYAFDNSYVSDSVAAHPERFTGVFSIDVVAPDAVAKMRHWMGKGLTGMRIFTSGSTHAEQETFFAEDAAFPVWQYASDQGLSVCMQMRVAESATELQLARGLVQRAADRCDEVARTGQRLTIEERAELKWHVAYVGELGRRSAAFLLAQIAQLDGAQIDGDRAAVAHLGVAHLDVVDDELALRRVLGRGLGRRLRFRQLGLDVLLDRAQVVALGPALVGDGGRLE